MTILPVDVRPFLWDIEMALKAVTYFVGYMVITVPIAGAFARWKAHYNPKIVQLEGAEEDANTKKINNVFQMLSRVYKVEGVAGLYKGVVPDLIAIAATLLVTGIAHLAHFGMDEFIRLRWHFENPVAFYFYEVFSRSVRVAVIVLFALPFTILYMRSVFMIQILRKNLTATHSVVTTPLVLPVHKPVLALRLLFTREELRRPWKLYTFPLIFAHAFPLAWTIEFLQRLHKIHPPLDHYGHGEYVWWRVLLASLGLIVGLVVFPPLEVIKAKLSVQRTGATQNVLPTEEQESQPQVAEYPEEVVAFRQEAYTGLIDCVRKIIWEEGMNALSRLWWVNAIIVFIISGVAKWALRI
ncbi:hypothetical protein HWV62_989 [Athelia sp. TMB]|nr:hypothetical protein HWV62_989 [Athelia sp. TMB]